jgi:single-strand DNA-binding protein
MNLVVLVGNLTRDPEVKYTQNGLAVAHINIAVNRAYKKDGGPDADFFRVTAFGKQAELVERYLSKGRKVGIEGRIQNDNYEKEGQTVYRDTIVAHNIEFLSPRDGGQSGSSNGYWPDEPSFGSAPGSAANELAGVPAPATPQSQTPGQSADTAPQKAASAGGLFNELEDDEDDLPF